MALDPEYESRLRANEKRIQKFIEEGTQRSVTGTYTLPVVVHVIYTDESADHNISDDQIHSAIQRLNEQFSGADGNSEDTNIRFQLATLDEDCQPTTGILRVDGSGVTNYTNHGIDVEYADSDGIGADIADVLELSRWNSNQYINIYIVNEINNNDGGYGVQGYSWVPGNPDPYDGVVLMYNTLGYDYDNCDCFELKSYTSLNTTFAHEIGHYLNLYHTFQGDNNGSSCPSTADNEGDYVADTPAHIRISSVCPSGNNNCYASNHQYFSIDLVGYNMMGYASAECRYQFSAGQGERMVAAIETSRPGLIYSPGLQTETISLTEPSCAPQSSTGLSAEYGIGLVKVKIGDLIAYSGGTFEDGGYLETSCLNTTVEKDQTYDIEISTWGNHNENVRVYIDWDNSGGMAGEELVFSGDSDTEFSGSFTVPNDATLNEWLRVRIISDHESKNINSSCFAPQYGQVEDYALMVQGQDPIINTSTAELTGFETIPTDASDTQSFTVSGTDLQGEISLSLENSSFEISTDGNSFSTSININPTGGVVENKTIYVRLKSGLDIGVKGETISIQSSLAEAIEVQLSGEVNGIENDRGNALVFDGDGDYLTSDFNLNPNSQSFTIETWLKMDSSETGFQVIFDQTSDDRSQLFMVSAWAHKFSIRFSGQWIELDPEATFEYDNWHHIALTWDGSIFSFYLDGVSIGSAEILTSESNLEKFHLGTYDESNAFFKGEIDELRIWDVARTQLEIIENMHLTSTVKSESGVYYFQFENSNGSEVSDFSEGHSMDINGEGLFNSSGVNVSYAGAAFSISDLSESDSVSFDDCMLSMKLNSSSEATDFTVIFQEHNENSMDGISASESFSESTWILYQNEGDAFSSDLTFSFSENYFSDLSAENYQLYHRSANSNGGWSLLKENALSINDSSISFGGVEVTGQFMVAKN